MCSVVGYVGARHAREIILEGLSRLEYRGYDSAGIACVEERTKALACVRAAGQLSKLREKLEEHAVDGRIAIGHTRWATHGGASEENAHPQCDAHKTLALVHNGIIENYAELKEELEESGHLLKSQTDTEVVAHLLRDLLTRHESCGERLCQNSTQERLRRAVSDLVVRLHGAFAFVVIFQDMPDLMLLVRKGSPLCVGIGQQEMFAASDLLAFAGQTNRVVFMPDESFAFVQADKLALYGFSGSELPVEVKEVTIDWHAEGKVGYDHYMLKEIYEQKRAIIDTVEFYRSLGDKVWEYLDVTPEQAKALSSLHILGCGTSWHAARIAQFFFEKIAMVPTQVHIGSEFRYMPFFPTPHSLFIAVSQSGETADTLEGLRMVSSTGVPTVALTNVASSTMVREADGFLLTKAGTEVAVASTKAFSTQLAVFYWFAHRIAREKGLITRDQMVYAEQELIQVAQVLEDAIERYKFDIMHTLGREYAVYKRCIFLGRHVMYPFALEAALKLKEVSYIFAQGFPSGELKHGPIALIDGHTPVFIFSHASDLMYQKVLSNAQEVKARGAHLVAFAFEGQRELINLADRAFVIPKVPSLLAPLAMTGLMQFLVYHVAHVLELPIDRPRNLAKSVTVE